MVNHDRHGSLAGWNQHQQDNTPPCWECRKARQVYDRNRNSTEEARTKSRARARAQKKAFQRLKAAHEVEYNRYYNEELVKEGL